MAKSYNKFSVLKYMFMKKTNNGTINIGKNIDFTLKEVGEAIIATGGTPPTSWSNFVLDLTRKKNTIQQRLPLEIIEYGYDLRKKTGRVASNSSDNYCGTFVYRGFDSHGNTIPIQDWLEWGVPDRTIIVNNCVPDLVKTFISDDEASLFSVIDYCDILSKVFNQKVYRVQSPMKWQPNEIDGYYVSECDSTIFAYPVEAKAISTADDINLVQMSGQFVTFLDKYKDNPFKLVVRPIAARMEKDGMILAVMEKDPSFSYQNQSSDKHILRVSEIVKIVLDKPLKNWNN